MKSPSKKTPHVPGQYLGYSLQATRFLMHLINSTPEWTVSLEVFEDVGVEVGGGIRIAEQDKSALKGNPVADRSVDLWKTFSNWVKAAQSGDLKPETTRYVLYVSHPKTGEIVRNFAQACSKTEAAKAFANAKKKLWGDAPRFAPKSQLSETLAPYVNSVLEPTKIWFVALFRTSNLNLVAAALTRISKRNFPKNLSLTKSSVTLCITRWDG